MVTAMRRRLRSRLCLGLLLALVGSSILGQTARGESLEAQRADFLKAYAVAQMGKPGWRAWAPKLEDYPLYPYLPAAKLEHNLHTITPDQVAAYLKRYNGLIPAADLRRNYLSVLATRRDWGDFLALYRSGFGDRLACYALQARIAGGEKLEFKRDLAVLWRKPSLPRACNKVQIWAHDHGLLTPARLWERIASAAKARRAGTIAWLARWLPHDQAVVARRYVEGLRYPTRAVRAAVRWPDTGGNREATLLAITQLARDDSARAVRDWPRLDKHFDFSKGARDRILRSLALHRAYGFHDDALALLTNLPAGARNASTRGWRIRIAIAERNWPAALQALDDAIANGRGEHESWQYLRARVLQELGKPKQAQTGFEALAGDSNYWGFLSADRLGRPYVLCPDDPVYSPTQLRSVLARPGFARAFELFAVGMLHDARREWARATRASNAETRDLAAALAYRRGWYSRAVFVYSYGETLHRYRERFPIAHRASVQVAASRTGLNTAWLYATIRAESGWVPDAGSGAGARGLMQLMPATARHVARRHHVSARGFRYDPGVNIRLGSDYLAWLVGLYDGKLWLATAAYNAGRSRVDDWLEARGELAPDLFIATIPFTQTRKYVIHIAAYSVVYDWLLNDKPTDLGWRLGGKAAGDDRRQVAVVCPSSPATAPATAPPPGTS
ncbi:MAG: transglycosylase SLT domain-containing protein [Gammaproteobacteria bacterium]